MCFYFFYFVFWCLTGVKHFSTKPNPAAWVWVLQPRHRKCLGWAAYKKLHKILIANHISVGLKVNILHASVFSVLLYGCEAWKLCLDDECRLNSFAMRCYRQILGVKYHEHICNEDIYTRVVRKPLRKPRRAWPLSIVGKRHSKHDERE